MKKGVLVSFLFLFSVSLFAQGSNFLVVHKPGKKKRYHYYIGDMIMVKPRLDYPVQRGNIYAITDSAVYFSKNDSLLYSDFESVIIKENTKPLSERLWLNNFLVTTGSIGIWQIAWLVNQGKLSPDVKSAPYIIGGATVFPIIVNQVCRIFVRGSRPIGPNEWQIGVVVMPNKPNE